MKKIFLSVLLILLFASVAFAQGPVWSYTKDFTSITNVNAICKDKSGNIWYASKTANSGLIVVKKDGTPLSFSPIKLVTVGTTSVNTQTGCQGIQLDQRGNIIAIFNGNDMVRIDSTGKGLTYVQIPAIGTNKEISNFGVDKNGNIYFTHVTQPAPLEIYDSTFKKVKNAVEIATDAPQCLAVTVTNTADWMWSTTDGSNMQGIQVYTGRTGGGSGIFHYRAGMDYDATSKTFTFSKDSVFAQVRIVQSFRTDVESFNWDGTSISCWLGQKGGKVVKVSLGADLKGNMMGKDSIVISGQISTPRGVIFDGTMSAYIADYDKNKIAQFTATPIKWNNWHFVNDLLRGTSEINCHGVVVDKKGIIWLANYTAWNTVSVPGATLPSILRFNPDFTIKDTIYRLKIGAGYDTLRGASRGMSLDDDGNILYCGGTTSAGGANTLYRINATTLEGMNKVLPGVGSLTNAAADKYGHIFLRDVASGSSKGVMIFPKDFNENSVPNIAVLPTDFTWIIRTLTVSSDGNDLILGATTAQSVAWFHSDNGSDGPYVFKQWIGAYPTGQVVVTDPNGKLWIGTDDYFRYDCWDLKTMTMIDGISQASTTDKTKGQIINTRGIAFSADGMNIITCDFGGGATQLWAKGPAGVNSKIQVPEDFKLSQNYPNPFNPSTKIKFTIPVSGNISVIIYDVFGREVFKAVDNLKYPAGNYEVTWSGRNTKGFKVASGTYFYKLKAANYEKTMKMMLIK